MRTVYACSLEFRTDKVLEKSIDLWGLVTVWCEETYQKHVKGCQSGINWNSSEAQESSTPNGGLIRLETLNDASGSTLREIRNNFPDQYDKTLIWNTDCRLLEDTHGYVFELSLTMSSADFSVTPARFQLGTPRIVRRMAETSLAEINGASIRNTPYRFSATDIDTLLQLLLWKERRFPVVVVSPDGKSGSPLIDSAVLAGHLSGVAVVVEPVDIWTTFALSDEVGKELSCFDGGIRIYWPGFSLESDPRHHGLWLGREIAEMGERAIAGELSRSIFAVAAYRYVEHPRIRRVRNDAMRIHAERSVERTRPDRDYDGLFEEYVVLDGKARELEEELEVLRNEVKNLRDNQTTLLEISSDTREHGGDEEGSESSVKTDCIESVLSAVEVAKLSCKNILFLDDAFRSAADSPYKNPERVLALLIALNEIAGEWKSGQTGRSWRDSFRDKGFEYKDDISQTSRGKWGDDYVHMYNGKPLLFEKHITIGAKQADKCLSVHFVRDEEKMIVVVAHVGRHKANTSS